MPEDLSPAQRAARTRKLRTIERGTQQKHAEAFAKARKSETASKDALRTYCEKHNWRVAFFEGATGSPIIFRISKGNADAIEIRLIQLKGGNAGMSGSEIARMKKAVGTVDINWMYAAFDGDSLHTLGGESGGEPNARVTPQSPSAGAKSVKRSEAAKRAWVTIRANRDKAGAKA
jgi:hypothetical protein